MLILNYTKTLLYTVLSSILFFFSRAKIIRSFGFYSVIKKDKTILKIQKNKFHIPKTLNLENKTTFEII